MFLPTIGLRWTNVTAASFNLTLAAAIIIARRRIPAADQAAVSTEERLDMAAVEAKLETAALPPPAVVDARSRRAALAAFAVSGATAVAGAVDAPRAVLLGSSVFSFTRSCSRS